MNASTARDDQEQSARPQFRVRSARDLFEKLSAPEAATRLAALQAVQQSPATALSFGLYGGKDVIDVLLQQAERFRAEMERLSWIGALAAFHDPRVIRLFTSLISSERNAELLFASAEYLRTEPVSNFQAAVTPALMQNECVARARAVACLLADSSVGSTGERLRIELLKAGGSVSFPAFAESPAEWLSELAGPFQLEARCELERQGSSTLSALADYWDQLSESNQEWLLEWGAEHDPGLVIASVLKALAGQSQRLVLAALHAAAKLDDVPGDLRMLILPFLHDRNEILRRAAVLSCSSDVNWRALLENETSVLVKQACLARLTASEGLQAVPDLLQHLRSQDWRIRAAAAEGLVALGVPAVRDAVMLAPQAGTSFRIGVARTLVHFDEQELLQQFLESCRNGDSLDEETPLYQS